MKIDGFIKYTININKLVLKNEIVLRIFNDKYSSGYSKKKVFGILDFIGFNENYIVDITREDSSVEYELKSHDEEWGKMYRVFVTFYKKGRCTVRIQKGRRSSLKQIMVI